MMTRAQILATKAEAQRFIDAADKALAQLDEENKGRIYPKPASAPDDYSYGSAATGTLRRRSMDLTRTLADLRRPRIWN
jgi:hypothetical protein